ncbi:MAG TPA: mannose-1-phosphate guanylyltransferase [Pirellulaceae bacterium]|nr:mannose-1-phosphate guanylyltransferase [Pirellulaceae bacterium]
MLHAVIMAGGAGTRFWPASRAARPKQLLDLTGERTMIQATVDRLGDLVPPERLLVVTNQQLIAPMAEQLPRLSAAALLGEPCKRDTAPCVGLAAMLVSHQDPDATMVILPADHVIAPEPAFREALASAVRMVDEAPQRLVTFGIRPTFPAESYGYIERGQPLGSSTARAFKVVKFREKPKLAIAEEYLATGNFYWNAGIFVWKAKTILAALAEYEPAIYEHLAAIGATIGTERFAETFATRFAAIQGKSIDYAVLERYPDVAVLEATFEWDDVGNWQSLARLRGVDDAGNTIVGKHLGIETHGTIVRSDDEHLVVTVGLQDCIVVHTPDATLVVNKRDEEAVRKVAELIKQRGWDKYL